MPEKPTYEELERRVRELEKAAAEHKQTEKVLQENEERFRFLSNASFEGLLIHDQGLVIDLNESATKLFGYTREEMLGKDIAQLCILEDYHAKIQENILKEVAKPYEVMARKKDGTLFPIEIESRDMKGKNGRFRIAAMRDITERKQAEEKLKASEEQHRSMIENTGTGMCILEEDTTISFVNQEYERITGYAKEEVEGKASWTEHIVPEDLELMRERHRQRRINEESPPNIYEFRLITKSGTIKNILLNINMIPGTSKSLASLNDITSHKKAEEALRISESRLLAIFEANPDPVVVYDVNGYPTHLNPAFTKVFGWNLSELRGRWIPFVPEDQRELTNAKIEEIYRTGKPVRFLSKRLTRQGHTLDVVVSAAIIKGLDATNTGMVVNLTDISEQRKLEAQLQQAQKMESIGTLAGGIAHNFNNVLMGIQGRISLMLMDKDRSAQDVEHLKEIEEYVKNATEWTKDLLGFARGGKYQARPTDLNALIKNENRIFSQTKKEIQIHGKYAPDLWTVEVDQGQIRQVLLNLYVNAWQAMPGGGDLYIQTENVSLDKTYVKPFDIAPGRYVKASVTDTGTGMDEKTRQKVFDPFFSTKDIDQGSGLGLASVYGIVKNHGGFINVYSEKGLGSTFTIYLPASDKQVMEEVTSPKADAIVYGKGTILLVDDEGMIIDVGQEMLENLGYKVLIAGSGKEALEIFKKYEQEIDLVILDMIMPGMGGGETYDRMKDIRPNVRVLLSSGYSINGEAKEILERGCKGFIQKPFSMNDLSIKVKEILAQTT